MTSTKIILRSFVVWLAIIALETLNGIFRELFITPRFGDQTARRISLCFAILVIFGIATLAINWIGTNRAREFLMVGVFWVALTPFFEAFVIGSLTGVSRERLFEDYDPRSGGLMALGLMFLAIVPVIAASLRSFVRSSQW